VIEIGTIQFTFFPRDHGVDLLRAVTTAQKKRPLGRACGNPAAFLVEGGSILPQRGAAAVQKK
jgi:hypothetical protein